MLFGTLEQEETLDSRWALSAAPVLFYQKEDITIKCASVMAKVNRCGQSAILSSDELDRLFDAMTPKCRAALSVCRYTAARISEALTLKWENITNGYIVLEKSNTKTKQTNAV